MARGRVTLQGNMDPNVLYGGEKAISEGVERMLKGFGNGGRHIINLGHGEWRLNGEVGGKDANWFVQVLRRL